MHLSEADKLWILYWWRLRIWIFRLDPGNRGYWVNWTWRRPMIMLIGSFCYTCLIEVLWLFLVWDPRAYKGDRRVREIEGGEEFAAEIERARTGRLGFALFAPVQARSSCATVALRSWSPISNGFASLLEEPIPEVQSLLLSLAMWTNCTVCLVAQKMEGMGKENLESYIVFFNLNCLKRIELSSQPSENRCIECKITF
jgi:hypothetical protein